MKKFTINTIKIGMMGAVLFLGLGNENVFSMDSQSRQLGQVLADGGPLGVSDPSQPDAVQIGKAEVNVEQGLVRFEVSGIGQSDRGILPQGLKVQGYLICNKKAGAQATVVSTPPVAVADNGVAHYSGTLVFPAECHDPAQQAFMVKVLHGEETAL